MAEPLHTVRFPGETEEYRRARDELLEGEIELRRQIEAVAAQRRSLPLGGEVPTDYGFEESTGDADGKRTVRLSELFDEGKDTLFVYSFMFTPGEAGGALDVACPACTSIIDAVDGEAPHIEQRMSLAVAAKVPIQQFRAHARTRGWRNVRLLSSANTTYNHDYRTESSDRNRTRSRPCSSVAKEGSTTSGAASSTLLTSSPARTHATSTSCGRSGTFSIARPRVAAATGARDSSTAELTSPNARDSRRESV